MLTSWGACKEAWEDFQHLNDLPNIFTTKWRDLHEIKPMGVKGGLLGLLYVMYLLNAAKNIYFFLCRCCGNCEQAVTCCKSMDLIRSAICERDRASLAEEYDKSTSPCPQVKEIHRTRPTRMRHRQHIPPLLRFLQGRTYEGVHIF